MKKILTALCLLATAGAWAAPQLIAHRGGTGDAQCPRMAALARPRPGAGGKGIVRGIPAQLAVAFGHSGDSFPI